MARSRFSIFTHRFAVVLLASLALTAAVTNLVMAHCDSMDGPVVKDAQRAIAEGNVEPVLKWVRAEDEDEIRTAFDLTMAVRGESESAQKVADQYFFDTLVRIHRASEGEGFIGIKPAGSTDPAIVATDRALAEGNIDELADKYADAVRDAIRRRFADAHQKRQVAENSVAQGREYVEAYVELTHFVEHIDHLLSHGASHQHRDTMAAAAEEHEEE